MGSDSPLHMDRASLEYGVHGVAQFRVSRCREGLTPWAYPAGNGALQAPNPLAAKALDAMGPEPIMSSGIGSSDSGLR